MLYRRQQQFCRKTIAYQNCLKEFMWHCHCGIYRNERELVSTSHRQVALPLRQIECRASIVLSWVLMKENSLRSFANASHCSNRCVRFGLETLFRCSERVFLRQWQVPTKALLGHKAHLNSGAVWIQMARFISRLKIRWLFASARMRPPAIRTHRGNDLALWPEFIGKEML